MYTAMGGGGDSGRYTVLSTDKAKAAETVPSPHAAPFHCHGELAEQAERMSAGCANRSTASHIIISSHRLIGFNILCLAATRSEAERIPLDYPKHLTRK